MAELTMHRHVDFNDLVFDQRNKAYGAYVLRRDYSTHILVSMMMGIFIIGSLLAIPYISAYIRSLNTTDEVKIDRDVVMTLENPPPVDPNDPPPPPPPSSAPPPMANTVAFTVPIVTNDIVNDITTVEDLSVSNPGDITQQGTGDFSIMPDGDGGNGDLIGETPTDEVFTVVEKMPEFPGGEKALMDFLAKNIRYPETAKDLGIQGTVYISFVVDTYGNITQVETLRGIGGGCDEEAARVVGKMPRWSPGKQGGRAVKVQYRLPIRFALNS